MKKEKPIVTLIVEGVHCPKCNHELSGHSSLQGALTPDIGDYTICVFCATILEYTEGMNLKIVTDESLKQLAVKQPREFFILMEGRTFYREALSKKPN